jgi:hypothetical protein
MLQYYLSESSQVFPATYYLNLSDYNIANPIDFGFGIQEKELRIFLLNEQIPYFKYLSF